MRATVLASLAAASLTLAGCGDEFASAPQPTVTLTPSIALTDTLVRLASATVEVQISDDQGNRLDSALVAWTSSDTTVVTVAADPTLAGPGIRRAVVSAHRTGSAIVTVEVIGGTGAASLGTYTDTITVLERWLAVDAGARHACAINIDSLAFCWGAPGGLLGIGSAAGSTTPVAVLGLAGLRMVAISAGEETTCALELGGVMYCWGLNRHGEIGNGTLDPHYLPTIGGGGALYHQISVGGHQTCGVIIALVCWGEASFGQLGEGVGSVGGTLTPCEFFQDVSFKIGTRQCALEPENVVQIIGTEILPAMQFSAGGLHACAIESPRDILPYALCWGLATVGQDGIPPGASYYEYQTTCVADPNGWFYSIDIPCRPWAGYVAAPSMAKISAGWDEGYEAHTCALTVDSLAYCWGRNGSGQLGTSYVDPAICTWIADSADIWGYGPSGSTPCSRGPTPVQTALKFSAIEAGMRSTCAIGAIDSLTYCWGDNARGELATGTVGGSRFQPAPIATALPLRFGSISAGKSFTCGVTQPAGAVYCWGEGSSGQLGNGGTTVRPRPVRIAEPNE